MKQLQKICASLLIVICFLGLVSVHGQCITSLPYKEDFEADDGGWTTGGTASDWEWGAPFKSLIKTAASGFKCWITGGINKTSYNNDEKAWLMAPCFDFTNISLPYVSFNIFWETERNFDGATLQYSTDGGNNWQTAGSVNDPVDCLTANWFNTASIRYMNNGNGWSGSVLAGVGGGGSGGGSGKWVVAKHSFPELAGLPDVRFRFFFGAGNTYNGYNGFAVDDFMVGEAPPVNAAFSYNCTSSTSVTFTNYSTGCPTSKWDFGDPASGASNTSALENPAHNFSGPGEYTITLTVTGAGNTVSAISQKINILKVDAVVTAGVTCEDAADGAAMASITPDIANASFTWNTQPEQLGNIASGLAAGNYIVSVSAPDACPSKGTVTLQEAIPISSSVTTVAPSCHKNDGGITIVPSGGVPPYSYSWLPNISAGATAQGLAAGNYTVIVKDSKGCTEQLDILLASNEIPTATIASQQDLLCFGNRNGTASVTVTGGQAPYTYQWLPEGGSGPSAAGLNGGVYTVTVTDSKGCASSATATIQEPGQLALSIAKTDATCGLSNGTAKASVSGGVAPFTYSWASNAGTYTSDSLYNLVPDTYYLTVTDANGCQVSDQSNIAGGSGLSIAATHTDVVCFGQKTGSATVSISGGSPAYSIVWSNGHTGSTNGNLSAGNYWVAVADAAYCTDTATVNILEPAALSPSLGSDTTICLPSSIRLSPGVFDKYIWQDGSTQPFFMVADAGRYSVTVFDGQGCSATDTINIVADCGQVYFPSAFTPNGNGLNEGFGPLGNLELIKDYRLSVFNRWGQLVFTSTNPFVKWDGKMGGRPVAGTYVWHARFSTPLEPGAVRKGTVMLIL